MSIREKMEKVKTCFLAYEKELFVTLLVILVAFLAFGLGRLSQIEEERQPVQIEDALPA